MLILTLTYSTVRIEGHPLLDVRIIHSGSLLNYACQTARCTKLPSFIQKRISRSKANHRRGGRKLYILRTKYYYLLFQAPRAVIRF